VEILAYLTDILLSVFNKVQCDIFHFPCPTQSISRHRNNRDKTD